GVGGVHQVVVDQGAGLEQLEGGTRLQQGLLVGHVGADGAVPPPAEGGAQPFPAAQGGACLDQEPGGVGTQGREAVCLLVEEVVQHGLDSGTEGHGVPAALDGGGG